MDHKDGIIGMFHMRQFVVDFVENITLEKVELYLNDLDLTVP